MADLAKEEGEKGMKELEKEFGVGKVCFVHLDVRDEEMRKAAWDQAEKFFGGQVQVCWSGSLGIVFSLCFSSCQVLMNNAGLFHRTNWKLMLDVNLGGLATGKLFGKEC